MTPRARLGIPLLAGAVLVVAGCGSSESGSGDAPADPGGRDEAVFGHVHGLGVDPADGALYVASHYGVFRVGDGSVDLVADRAQDTMGFVVVGDGRFLGSGHPDPDVNLPPSLGLVQSTDAGRTWQPLSLLGEADLHAIEQAGSAIYAYDSTSQSLIVSDDGQRWAAIAQLLPVLDIAVDPAVPDTVHVVTADGELLRSSGGAEPSPVFGAPEQLSLVDWQPGGPLVAVDRRGQVMTSPDGDSGWTRAGSLRAPVEALDVAPGRWHAATEDAVLESTDDGATWGVVVERDG